MYLNVKFQTKVATTYFEQLQLISWLQLNNVRFLMTKLTP